MKRSQTVAICSAMFLHQKRSSFYVYKHAHRWTTKGMRTLATATNARFLFLCPALSSAASWSVVVLGVVEPCKNSGKWERVKWGGRGHLEVPLVDAGGAPPRRKNAPCALCSNILTRRLTRKRRASAYIQST